MKAILKSIILSALLALSFNLSAAPVNINTADAKTLAANINGVGNKKAEEIVQYRDKHGPFKSADDLAKVKGIGPNLIEKNRDILLVKSTKKSK
jgi:competence protein ComEA